MALTLADIVHLVNAELVKLTMENPTLSVRDIFGRINDFSLPSQDSQKTFTHSITNAWVNTDLHKRFAQNTSNFTNFFSFQLDPADMTNHNVVDDGFTFSFDFVGEYVSPVGFTIWNRITSLFSADVTRSSQVASFKSLKIRGMLTFQVSDLTLEQDPITQQYTFTQPSTGMTKIYNLRWSALSIDFPTTTKIVHTLYKNPEQVSTMLAKNLSSVIADFEPVLVQVLADELNIHFKNIVLTC
jgi:hypothetical protein